VGLAILSGIYLGNMFPKFFQNISEIEYANINLPIAVLIWIMIYPMMMQVDFSKIKDVFYNPKGLVITLIVNWLVKPFTMTLLGWFFFKFVFATLVTPQSAQEYIAGIILLGVAPCTAMVFVWSKLTDGDSNYTLVQVAINDLIIIFMFAPIAKILLGIGNIIVPWNTLFFSVVLYVVLPLTAGILTRKVFREKERVIMKFNYFIKPFSIMGLIGTVVFLFAFQAQTIIQKPFIILLIAIPLLIQTYGIFAIAYFASFKYKLPHNIAGPASMIGASNFFELAVAVAIGLFGLNSGAALATVVGVLVEVPVMLSLVAYSNRTKKYFSEIIVS
jgi:ACR3 family arsenite transporter